MSTLLTLCRSITTLAPKHVQPVVAKARGLRSICHARCSSGPCGRRKTPDHSVTQNPPFARSAGCELSNDVTARCSNSRYVVRQVNQIVRTDRVRLHNSRRGCSKGERFFGSAGLPASLALTSFRLCPGPQFHLRSDWAWGACEDKLSAAALQFSSADLRFCATLGRRRRCPKVSF